MNKYIKLKKQNNMEYLQQKKPWVSSTHCILFRGRKKKVERIRTMRDAGLYMKRGGIYAYRTR